MTRRSNTRTVLVAALASGLLLSGPAAAQSPKVSKDPQLRGTAEALMIWTLAGIDQAKKSGTVAALRGAGTRAYRRRVSARRLRTMVRKIKADDFATIADAFKRFPGRVSFSRLQKLGATGIAADACYCPEGYHLFLRMRYRRVGRRWRIDAMKVWDHVD
jgi:hypothetical protein